MNHGSRPDPRVRLDAWFDEALSLEGDARDALLRRIEAEDAALAMDLRALLRLAAAEDAALPLPAVGPARWAALFDDDAHARDDAPLPGRIGVWTPVARIGHGGMGTVYRVERDADGFHQTGALKLLRPGTESEDFLRRFTEERRILATLTHPGIARLLDGGRSADGRPYLVMEYVDGRPLDRACDERALDIDARIALFLRIADAVAHAHRNLVAHRDLKPGNILIGADGAPKLLDFGIAKAFEARADDPATGEVTVAPTLFQAFTPDYAAPEQVLGHPTSTVTDVYQLGLLLYELLTGHRAQHAQEASPRAIETAVCTTVPPRPSERVGDDDHQRCAARATTPAALRRKLRGDLDNIVSKALRKAPERRYASVAALIEDLERWRRGQTVRARPETWTYRTGKFLKRNAWAVVATTTIFALILGYAITATLQADALARERDRARAETAKAQKTLELLNIVFALSSPRNSGGIQLSARQALDAAWRAIEKELGNEPEMEAELVDAIGNAYREAGEYQTARGLLERGLHASRRLAGSRPLLLARAQRSLGEVLSLQEEFLSAQTHLRAALAGYRAVHGPRHRDIAQTLHLLGVLEERRGDFAAAASLHRDALAMRRGLFGERNPNVAESINRLGLVLRQQGDYAGAEPLLSQALTLRRQLLPQQHPDLLGSLSNVAMIRADLGEYDAAEQLYREALARLIGSLGKDHPEVAIVMGNLALLLQKSGRTADARPLMDEVLRIRRRALGERHPLTAQTLSDMGLLLAGDGDPESAERYYLQALDAFPETHRGRGATVFNLGQLAERRGDFATAERRYREAIVLQRRDFGDDHDRVGADLNRLGVVLHRQGRLAEAETSMRQALAIYRRRLPAGHRRIALVLMPFPALLLERGKRDEAIALLEEALKIRGVALGENDPLTRETADALRRAKRGT